MTLCLFPLPSLPSLPQPLCLSCSPIRLAQGAFLTGRPSQLPIDKAGNSLFCTPFMGQGQDSEVLLPGFNPCSLCDLGQII